MTVDLNLPAFGLDCRDWLVATEAEGLLVEQTDEAPIVAVLSTAVVVGQDLVSARAVLSLALLDDDDPDNTDAHAEFAESGGLDSDGLNSDGLNSDGLGVDVSGVDGLSVDGLDHDHPAPDDVTAHDAFRDVIAAQDICVLEAEWSDGYARFAVPAPGGELAVVAEFSSAPNPSPELIDRFYDLVTSFRWAA